MRTHKELENAVKEIKTAISEEIAKENPNWDTLNYLQENLTQVMLQLDDLEINARIQQFINKQNQDHE